MTVQVRRAGAGDAESLALVGQATFLESYAGQLNAGDILAHCALQHAVAVYEGWLADPRMRLWLAEAHPGGAPVGYAVSGPANLPIPDPRPGDVEIRRLYLLHRFHGAGVGWALMRAALENARVSSASRALLGVNSDNARALSFYWRIGFQAIGTRKFLVGKTWCDDLILGLDLTEPNDDRGERMMQH